MQFRELHPRSRHGIFTSNYFKRRSHNMRAAELYKGRHMQKLVILLSCGLALAACSSTVNGALAKACIDADRSAASPQLCSCVQRVANRTLSGSDQALAATFFEDPQLAQDTRQAGTSYTSAFWARYRAFSNTARSSCG
jgi:hypothetical protein